MKQLLKRLLGWAARDELVWFFLSRTIVPLGYYLSVQNALSIKQKQAQQEHKDLTDLLARVCPDNRVLRGPFKGLRYPQLQAVGSALAPKLLGSYECELNDSINLFCQTEYDVVVDIGCAEGYYAVGFATKLPNAMVHAFDIDEHARRLCYQMAIKNQVGDRVITKGFCDQETLIQLVKNAKKALVICDCEGYEKSLFANSPALRLALKKHDLMVETHDFLDIEISSSIRATFLETHTIESVLSVSDTIKARDCEYPECKDLHLRERYRLLAEQRPQQMEWLVMRAKA